MSDIHIVLPLAMSAAIVDAQRLPRVRSETALITKTITEASERSATFRRLVERIDSSDGLVYIEEGSCAFSLRAYLILRARSPARIAFCASAWTRVKPRVAISWSRLATSCITRPSC